MGCIFIICSSFAILFAHDIEVKNCIAEISMLHDGLSVSVGHFGDFKKKASDGADFATQLPRDIKSQALLIEIKRAVKSAGVAIIGVEARVRFATNEMLGREDFSVSLEGGYSQIKRLSSEIIDRFPHCTLQRMSIQRSAQSDEKVEATMVFGLWGAPSLTIPSLLDSVMPVGNRR